MGYTLDVLPRAEYLARLRQRLEAGDLSEGLELAAPHLGARSEQDEGSTLRYDAHLTLEALGLRAAGGAKELIRHVVEAGVSSGYLPSPRRTGVMP